MTTSTNVGDLLQGEGSIQPNLSEVGVQVFAFGPTCQSGRWMKQAHFTCTPRTTDSCSRV